MPTLFEWKGWKFLFYSMEGTEPPHVHARRDRKEAKFWLDPVRLARNRRCADHEINALLVVVRQRRQVLLEQWHEHLGNR